MADTVLYQSAHFGFLGVSAGNVFVLMGPAIMACFGEVCVTGCEQLDRTAGLVSYPSEAVERVPRFPKFSGQTY